MARDLPNFEGIQKNGTLAHWGIHVRNLLNKNFFICLVLPNLSWLALSPDLTPMTFFCWVTLKVYTISILGMNKQ